MGTSDDSIEDLYKDINKINNYFYEDTSGQLKLSKNHELLHNYCHYGGTSGNGKCNDYFEMASSGVIHLLKTLEKHNLGYDKLAEYAILWLIYKLNAQEKSGDMNLNDFYTNYIVNNNCYKDKIKGDPSMTYKAIIDKIKELMNIKELSNFSYPFSILFNLYDMVYYGYVDCENKSNYAKNFADKFKELNDDSNNIEGSLYNKMISTLSNDYNKLKNIYHSKNKSCDFPSLPKLNPKKGPAQNVVDNFVEKTVEKPGQSSAQLTALPSEGTSSSSSISTTLIPGLSVVSVISVFLGIAYKYSLFGIDKLFQRQYLRTKLKKVKKKMKLNI
ncbi:CIR protein PIR protein [Plasmodium vinckei petteri]|uniref:CIR protein PIR protein n=1 Tax=Plasmodium vinckei petteri TaxID=138298 RepID=A0A6V7T180_PLAVN|nr:CIR protein PIR protein [Plasmodium vinckei petteri]